MPNPQQPQKSLLSYLYLPMLFVWLLWVVKLFELITDKSFIQFGLLPRTTWRLMGIITGPLIHANVAHLMSNTLPLLIFGWMLFYFFPTSAKKVFLNVYLFSGIFVWLLGREHFHIGASGIVYGLALFILTTSILHKDQRSMALVAIIIIFYGGMIWGIFPGQEQISWESHLGGTLTGIVLAFLYRNNDLPEPEIVLTDDDEPSPINYRYIYIPKGREKRTDDPEPQIGNH